MGGKAKAWATGLGVLAASVLTGGAAGLAYAGTAGLASGALAGGAVGALAGTQAGLDTHKGQVQARIAEEANRQQEALDKRQRGATPQQKEESALAVSALRKIRSAHRRTNQTEGQKLGD